MTQAHAALLREVEFMILAFAQQYARRFSRVRREDLAQEGRRVALEIAGRFDPNRGATFATFCYQRVLGAMLDYAKKELQAPVPVSFSKFAARDEGPDARDSLTLGADSPEQALLGTLQGRIAAFVSHQVLNPTAPSVEELHGAAARSELVRSAVASLPSDASTFVRLFYEEGLTLEEVANNMNVSKRTAGRTHQRVKEMLSRRLFDSVE